MEVTLASVNEAIKFISQLKALSIPTQDLKIIINDSVSEYTSKNELIEKSLPLVSISKDTQISNQQVKTKPLVLEQEKIIPNINNIENILNKDRFILVKNRLIELAENGYLSINCTADDIRSKPTRVLQHHFHTTRYHGKSAFSVWEKNSLIVETLKDSNFISDLSNLLNWDEDFVNKLLKTPSKRGKVHAEEDAAAIDKKANKISPLNARIGYKHFEKHVRQLIQNGKLPPQKEDTPKFNDYLAKISKTSLLNSKNIFWMWQSLGQIKTILQPDNIKKVCKTFHLSENEFMTIISNQIEMKTATH